MTWPERKVEWVKLRKQQSSFSCAWRWRRMERNICFPNWEGRLIVLHSGQGSRDCPTHSSLMMRQDRVMELEGDEQELLSSCHRLNCKFMVFMSFVLYKYIWQAIIYARMQLFLWFKDKKQYCIRSAVKNFSKWCKLLIAIGHEKYPVHWRFTFRYDWVENFLSYLQSSFLPNAVVRQPWPSSVSDNQKMKSPWPRNGHMGNDPEKKSIHVPGETRRENFLNCQPSRIISSVTRAEWSASEQTTGFLQALQIMLSEHNFKEAVSSGKKAGNRPASINTLRNHWPIPHSFWSLTFAPHLLGFVMT